MVRTMTVLLALGFLAWLVPPSPAVAQVPTVKMKGETARERFQMIRNDLLPGGSMVSPAVVPAKQRLVITDLLISANGLACNIEVRRSASFWDCPGAGDTPLTASMCVPSTGGTVSHTFATGLVIPEGERACVIREADAGAGVAQVLLRGYYTKAKK